jgi:hypothetical protein
MITINNYFEEVPKTRPDTFPETLKKGHDLVMRSTSNGTSWANYHSSDSIKKVIDLYLDKLNEYLKSRTIPRIETNEDATEKVKKPKAERKAPKNTDAKPTNNVKHVEHIREEVKFIKRYVGLHNKVKSPNTILAFVKALQRSIVQKLIRKTSPLASEIEMIQDKLVHAYNKMKGEESFAINEKDLHRLVAIAGGEAVYPSITVIKRFIGLQGKDDEKKINDFMKYVENMLAKKKLQNDDPYLDKVNAIHQKLKDRSSQKVIASKAELNGLEGILQACSCAKQSRKLGRGSVKVVPKKTHTHVTPGSTASGRPSPKPKGLNGVLTAERDGNPET